uniref:Uncharacterized protein n=1 Tax=Rhizophora mucronata TaxID=61149 RepID=A0A2P2PTM6_RHIMU
MQILGSILESATTMGWAFVVLPYWFSVKEVFEVDVCLALECTSANTALEA